MNSSLQKSIDIIFGNDYLKSQAYLDKKKTQSSKAVIFDEHDSERDILEYMYGVSLFDSFDVGSDEGGKKKEMIIIKNMLDIEHLDFIKKILREPTWSEKFDVVLVHIADTSFKLVKDMKEIIEEYGISPQEYKKATREDKRIFALTDAIGSRDIKKSWLMLHTLKQENPASAHHVFGTIWWFLKNILLLTREPETNSLSGYVKTKTSSHIKNFTELEIKNYCKKFIGITEYEQGAEALWDHIERWILNLKK